MRQLRRKFTVHFSPAKLWRLRRNKYRLQRFLWIRLEQITELLPHFFRVHIADNDEDEIVRYVTGLIILHHLLLRKLVINLQLADDWKSVGMPLICCTKKQQASHAIGIIHAHREPAPDGYRVYLVIVRRTAAHNYRHVRRINRRE